MTAQNENRLTMWGVVLSMLPSFNSIWGSLAPFSALVTTIQSLYAEVATQRNIQAQGTKGITIQKKKLRTKATTLAIPILGAIRTYGKANDIYALFTFNSVTVSYIESLRDTIAVMELQRVLDAANANSVGLATYGITATMLTDLQTAIVDYSTSVALPRVLLSQKVAATRKIDDLIMQGQAALKDLDDIALIFSNTHSDFVAELRKARKIINLGHRYTSATYDIITNMQDDAEVVLTSDNATYTAQKDENGKYHFPSIRPGRYQIDIINTTIEYAPQTIRVKSGVSNTAQLTFNGA
jgi:hypothetical protein